MLDVAENPRAVAGHNEPPEPTPFERCKNDIEDLFLEAKNWLDGAPVENQVQADAIAKLIVDLRAASKRAEDWRVRENKPFDEGKAEVQGRYNPLLQKGRGKVELAISTCKLALVPFLDRQEAERVAQAARVRLEADEMARRARDALRTSQGDLSKREAAEKLLVEAAVAGRVAKTVEKARAMACGGGRAITLRTSYVAVLSDRREAARFMWKACPEQFDALLLRLAQDFVDAGRRTLPGIDIVQMKSAQ